MKRHIDVAGTAMVVVSIVAVQLGAAIAAGMFDEVGASAMTFLRLGFAAIVLCAVGRPALRGRSSRDWLLTVSFGALAAVLALASYAAVDRLPLGLVVTLELLGPLGLSVAMSRRAREVGWIAVALVGVVLLGGGVDHIDPMGVVLSLVGAAAWAGYILLSAETGRRTEGVDGLALAIAVAAVLVAPLGIAGGGTALLRPGVLAVGAVVALMTSVVNFALELAALRRMPERVFGVLMSLNPAIAALAGLVVLGQRLSLVQALGVSLVVAASAATVTGSGAAADAAAAAA